MKSEVTQERIREMALRLAEALDARQVWLFGSRAWGTPDADSDVDLMVVVPDSDLPVHKRCQQAYRALRDFAVPKDVLVFTRAEVEERAREDASLVARILRKGSLVFENAVEFAAPNATGSPEPVLTCG